MLGALGDPVDHLLFHHPRLQASHELGVVAIQLNDLLRLFVRAGDEAHRLVQALGLELELVAARDLADLVERIGNGAAPVAVGLAPRVIAEAPEGAMPA